MPLGHDSASCYFTEPPPCHLYPGPSPLLCPHFFTLSTHLYPVHSSLPCPLVFNLSPSIHHVPSSFTLSPCLYPVLSSLPCPLIFTLSLVFTMSTHFSPFPRVLTLFHQLHPVLLSLFTLSPRLYSIPSSLPCPLVFALSLIFYPALLSLLCPVIFTLLYSVPSFLRSTFLCYPVPSMFTYSYFSLH